VGVVLVLVDLAILRIGLPRHGALANADVALGVHGGGLAAEVPIISRIPNKLATVRLAWDYAPLDDESQPNDPAEGVVGRHNGGNGAKYLYMRRYRVISGVMLTIQQLGKHQT
jgi:hypothetical protein